MTMVHDAEAYDRLPEAGRDAIADRWGDVIYFCCECDEENREREDYTRCPRFPREHDETGYMGTGTDYPPDIRDLARKIARD
jgi:hypothetical protein